jgi:Leucine-rich repeat (LRR) protein
MSSEKKKDQTIPGIDSIVLKKAVLSYELDLSSITYEEFESNKSIERIIFWLEQNPDVKALRIDLSTMEKNDVAALCQCSKLTFLSAVCCCSIEDECAIALAQNPTLKTLIVPGCKIGNKGIKALAQSTTLEELDVTHNFSGGEGIELLASSRTIRSLVVSVESCSFKMLDAFSGNTALTSLALSTSAFEEGSFRSLQHVQNLRSLTLSFLSRSIREDVKDLALCPSLTELNVCGCGIDDVCVQILTKNSTLTSLNVSSSSISDAGVKILAQSSHLAKLDIRNNRIGNEGIQALAKNQTLTSLSLSGPVEHKILKTLIQNPNLLSLTIGKISIEDAKVITTSSSLTFLDVRCTTLGDFICKVLAKSKTLQTLILPGCEVADEGVIALAKNKTLTSLEPDHNKIGRKGVRALAENMAIKHLCISRNPGSDILEEILDRRILHSQDRSALESLLFSLLTFPSDLEKLILGYCKPEPFTVKENKVNHFCISTIRRNSGCELTYLP